VLLLAGSCPSAAQIRVSDNSPEKTKLIALENAWNQAQIHRDGQALDSLVSDEFVYTDTDGTVLKKAKFIEDIKDPAGQMTFLANDNVEVFLYPGVAVVVGAYHAKGKWQGRAYDHYGRFTDTWIRVGDQWMCVASHTNLTKGPAHN
jgi:ketosteroid isomerase-like protein